MTFSDAMYVRDSMFPPSFMMGPNFWRRDTAEYADADDAARYPFRDVSRRGFVTSGPFARECTRMSILP